MTSDLSRRLRLKWKRGPVVNALLHEAADRIDELEAEIERLRAALPCVCSAPDVWCERHQA